MRMFARIASVMTSWSRSNSCKAITPRTSSSSQHTQEEWLRHVGTLTAEACLHELDVTEGGLTSERVEEMRLFWGAEAQTKGKPAVYFRFLSACADPFTYILVAIAVVSFITDWVFAPKGSQDLSTPIIIGIMIFVAALLRFIQTEQNGNAADALQEMIKTTCSVRRADSGLIQINVEDLVVGDIVELASGDVIAADLKLLHARDLFVSQSSLTGESESIEKTVRNTTHTSDGGIQKSILDEASLVFAGSSIISGTGTAVVVACSTHTLLGSMSSQLSHIKRVSSTSLGIKKTSWLLIALMLAMVPTVFVIVGITKQNWLEALLFALSLAVGLTPEMLPMLISCCLGKGALDLSHQKVITKRFDAIQDFGGIDVLCCDKTGTLTLDKVVLEQHLDIFGNEDLRVLNWAFLNSFFGTGVKNLIDSAILRYALEKDPRNDTLVDTYHLIDEIPFDFQRRRVSVVVGDTNQETTLICKGALEELLECCSSVQWHDETKPLTADIKAMVLSSAHQFQEQGMRVLGVATLANPQGVQILSADSEHNLCLMGYLTFLDPPKESAARALVALHNAGVTVKVLTGDSGRIAAHVCQKVGLPHSQVCLGHEIEIMSDTELDHCVETTHIFAKLSPAQKARIVARLQEHGHCVGFMGDGVNDAQAMQTSDCGISVDSAVDVAREAADIILLKKDLQVLEMGIAAGRRAYVNLIKYVKMTVASNFGNILSILLASILLPFLPMNAVQLLLLNLIYDVSCTALAWDNVDAQLIAHPRIWDARAIRRIMFTLGPVSTVFDLITFAALYFWLCPAVCGAPFEMLDPEQQVLFIATFQAGWFVVSMWTQTLTLHFLRTEQLSWIESMPCKSLIGLSLAGIALASWLPVSPFAFALDMAPLPVAFIGLLIGILIGFGLTLMGAKSLYIKYFGSLI